ncbi:MAG: MFS transporter [Chitinivibrionales bacterium]|nr:MFS transporter [Chitinivibrionales bacterium]
MGAKNDTDVLIERLPFIVFGVFFNVAAMPNLLKVASVQHSLQFSEVSGLISYYQTFYGTAALFSCYFTLNFSKKKILIIALLAFSFLNACIFFVTDIHRVVILRALVGIPASMIIPTALTAIGEISKKRGKRTGIIFITTSIASTCGIFLSGFLPWRSFFLIPAIISLFNVFLLLSVKNDRTDAGGNKQKVPITRIFKKYVAILFEPAIQKIFSGIFLNAFLMASIDSYMAFFLSERLTIGQERIASILVFGTFGGIIGNYFSGKLVDGYLWFKSLWVGVVIVSVSIFFISVNLSLPIMYMLFMSRSVGRSLIHLALVNKFVCLENEVRPYVASLNSVCVFISGSLSVFFFSSIQPIIQFEHYLLGVSVMYVMFLVVTVTYRHRVALVSGIMLHAFGIINRLQYSYLRIGRRNDSD